MELKDEGTSEFGHISLNRTCTYSFLLLDPGCRWRKGDALKLVRDAGDRTVSAKVSVYLAGTGGQPDQKLGELRDDHLARHLDGCGAVVARIACRRGGLNRLRRWANRLRRKPVLLSAQVTKGEVEWLHVAPIIETSNNIGMKIERANCLRKRQPRQALALYRDAISDIFDLHFDNPGARSWRRVRYPVNELSALLEQLGELRAAYQAIRDYENFQDDLGLSAQELKEVRARKLRLEKQFIFNCSPHGKLPANGKLSSAEATEKTTSFSCKAPAIESSLSVSERMMR